MLNLQPFKKKLKKLRENLKKLMKYLKTKKLCRIKFYQWCLKCKIVHRPIFFRILVINQNLINNLTVQKINQLRLEVDPRIQENLAIIKDFLGRSKIFLKILIKARNLIKILQEDNHFFLPKKIILAFKFIQKALEILIINQ